MDLKEMRWYGVDFIHLAQGRDWWQARVNTVTDFWVPLNVGNVFD
jgi:hypothetical protein